MSNEERQRTLREAGPRPAQAEKEEDARRGRERLGRLQGERETEDRGSPDEPKPLAEDDETRPRPRR